jgi:hypothetical protein
MKFFILSVLYSARTEDGISIVYGYPMACENTIYSQVEVEGKMVEVQLRAQIDNLTKIS